MSAYGIGRDAYNYKYATPATQPDAYNTNNHYDPDHVCKPVYIDDQGRKRPIIAYTSPQASQSKTEYYVSKVESVIKQRVKPPFASLGHAAADLLKNRGGSEQKTSNGSSPFNPAKETSKDFFSRVHEEMNRTKSGPVGGATDWRQTPTSGYGTGGGGNSYTTTSNRPNTNSATDDWRQTRPSTGYYGTGGGTNNYNTTSNRRNTILTDDWRHTPPSMGYYGIGGSNNNYNTISNKPNPSATDDWRQTPTGYYGTGGGGNNYNTTSHKPNTSATDDWRHTPPSTGYYGTGGSNSNYNTISNKPNASVTDDWRQAPPSTGYYGTSGGSNDYNTTGSRPNTRSTNDWPQTPPSTGYYGTGDGSNDYNTTGNRPNASTTDNYNKYGSTTGPGMITSGGWARPSRETWATPPITSSYNPSNDLGDSQRPITSIFKPSVPNTSSDTSTIGTSDTTSRYGSFTPLSRKVENKFLPKPTIDSMEASSKYRGTNV